MQTMDLKKYSSRIICSDNIIRNNLNKQSVISATSDDDEQFFQKIKSEIDKNHLYSKENYKLNTKYQSTSSLRKKRFVIDEETENIIKRFKKERNHASHSVQTLRDINILESNLKHNNIKKKPHDIITNYNTTNTVQQQQNMFVSNLLTTDLRNTNNYVFQVASKVQQNILPLATKETTFLQEEYEESLLYALFLTPPNSNSTEDSEDYQSCSTINTII